MHTLQNLKIHHHSQSPSFRQSVKWLGLLGCWLHIHCYGDGAQVPSKEAEMIYREAHPSWMAMREAHPPNNTNAWRTSGPFNLKERVPCGHLWGHFSHHQVMWGSGSSSIVVVSVGGRVSEGVAVGKVFLRGENGKYKPTHWCCVTGYLLLWRFRISIQYLLFYPFGGVRSKW